MPQVELFYRGEKLSRGARNSLRDLLPQIVSAALHVDEVNMHLSPKDIGVRFFPTGPDDVLTHDVEIKISANFYPERKQKIQEGAADAIVRQVQLFIPIGATFYIWINLIEASFAEGKGISPR